MMKTFTLIVLILAYTFSTTMAQPVGGEPAIDSISRYGVDCEDDRGKWLIIQRREQIALLNKADAELNEVEAMVIKGSPTLSDEEKAVYKKQIDILRTEKKEVQSTLDATITEKDAMEAERNQKAAEAQENKEAADYWEKETRRSKRESQEYRANAEAEREAKDELIKEKWALERALAMTKDSLRQARAERDVERLNRIEAERIINVYEARELVRLDNIAAMQNSDDQVMDIDFDLSLPWRNTRNMMDSSLQFLNVELEQQITVFRKGEQVDVLSLESDWEENGYGRVIQIKDASRGKYHVRLKVRLKNGKLKLFGDKKMRYEIPLKVDLSKISFIPRPMVEMINKIADGKIIITERGAEVVFRKHGLELLDSNNKNKANETK